MPAPNTKTERELKSMSREREEKSGRKSGLTGEMKNLGPILEEKERISSEYRQIRERIRGELTAIPGLKLLVRLMAQSMAQI